MKEIKTIKYESNDGRIFENKDHCIRWETCLALDTEILRAEINKFLSNADNYEEWYQSQLRENSNYDYCKEMHLGQRNGGTYNLTLGNMYEDGFVELDEDFAIDMDKWDAFYAEIKKKYNVNLDENMYYWPK
jgi:hypothetical protein